jgi:hypothetical protein
VWQPVVDEIRGRLADPTQSGKIELFPILQGRRAAHEASEQRTTGIGARSANSRSGWKNARGAWRWNRQCDFVRSDIASELRRAGRERKARRHRSVDGTRTLAEDVVEGDPDEAVLSQIAEIAGAVAVHPEVIGINRSKQRIIGIRIQSPPQLEELEPRLHAGR